MQEDINLKDNTQQTNDPIPFKKKLYKDVENEYKISGYDIGISEQEFYDKLKDNKNKQKLYDILEDKYKRENKKFEDKQTFFNKIDTEFGYSKNKSGEFLKPPTENKKDVGLFDIPQTPDFKKEKEVENKNIDEFISLNENLISSANTLNKYNKLSNDYNEIAKTINEQINLLDKSYPDYNNKKSQIISDNKESVQGLQNIKSEIEKLGLTEQKIYEIRNSKELYNEKLKQISNYKLTPEQLKKLGIPFDNGSKLNKISLLSNVPTNIVNDNIPTSKSVRDKLPTNQQERFNKWKEQTQKNTDLAINNYVKNKALIDKLNETQVNNLLQQTKQSVSQGKLVPIQENGQYDLAKTSNYLDASKKVLLNATIGTVIHFNTLFTGALSKLIGNTKILENQLKIQEDFNKNLENKFGVSKGAVGAFEQMADLVSLAIPIGAYTKGAAEIGGATKFGKALKTTKKGTEKFNKIASTIGGTTTFSIDRFANTLENNYQQLINDEALVYGGIEKIPEDRKADVIKKASNDAFISAVAGAPVDIAFFAFHTKEYNNFLKTLSLSVAKASTLGGIQGAALAGLSNIEGGYENKDVLNSFAQSAKDFALIDLGFKISSGILKTGSKVIDNAAKIYMSKVNPKIIESLLKNYNTEMVKNLVETQEVIEDVQQGTNDLVQQVTDNFNKNYLDTKQTEDKLKDIPEEKRTSNVIGIQVGIDNLDKELELNYKAISEIEKQTQEKLKNAPEISKSFIVEDANGAIENINKKIESLSLAKKKAIERQKKYLDLNEDEVIENDLETERKSTEKNTEQAEKQAEKQEIESGLVTEPTDNVGDIITIEPKKNEQAEPPKFEPPKFEPPKVEPPKVEPPKVEPPKVEPPKVEQTEQVKKNSENDVEVELSEEEKERLENVKSKRKKQQYNKKEYIDKNGEIKYSIEDENINNFQSMVRAAQELSEYIRKKIKINPDGSIYLYHGTNKNNIENINKEGFNKNSFFSISENGLKNGDSPFDVAKRKYGKDGIVIKVKIDARYVENAAAGSEIYSPYKLVKNNSGIFTIEKNEINNEAHSKNKKYSIEDEMQNDLNDIYDIVGGKKITESKFETIKKSLGVENITFEEYNEYQEKQEKIKIDEENYKKESEQDNTTISELVNVINENSNGDLKIVVGEVKNKRIGAVAFFDPKTNTITISSKLDPKTKLSKIGHEVTHFLEAFIENVAKTQNNEIAKAILKKKDMVLKELEEYIGKSITTKEGLEYVRKELGISDKYKGVDLINEIFPKLIERELNKNDTEAKGIFKKMKDIVKDYVQKIKDFIFGLKGFSDIKSVEDLMSLTSQDFIKRFSEETLSGGKNIKDLIKAENDKKKNAENQTLKKLRDEFKDNPRILELFGYKYTHEAWKADDVVDIYNGFLKKSLLGDNIDFIKFRNIIDSLEKTPFEDAKGGFLLGFVKELADHIAKLDKPDVTLENLLKNSTKELKIISNRAGKSLYSFSLFEQLYHLTWGTNENNTELLKRLFNVNTKKQEGIAKESIRQVQNLLGVETEESSLLNNEEVKKKDELIQKLRNEIKDLSLEFLKKVKSHYKNIPDEILEEIAENYSNKIKYSLEDLILDVEKKTNIKVDRKKIYNEVKEAKSKKEILDSKLERLKKENEQLKNGIIKANKSKKEIKLTEEEQKIQDEIDDLKQTNYLLKRSIQIKKQIDELRKGNLPDKVERIKDLTDEQQEIQDQINEAKQTRSLLTRRIKINEQIDELRKGNLPDKVERIKDLTDEQQEIQDQINEAKQTRSLLTQKIRLEEKERDIDNNIESPKKEKSELTDEQKELLNQNTIKKRTINLKEKLNKLKKENEDLVNGDYVEKETKKDSEDVELTDEQKNINEDLDEEEIRNLALKVLRKDEIDKAENAINILEKGGAKFTEKQRKKLISELFKIIINSKNGNKQTDIDLLNALNKSLGTNRQVITLEQTNRIREINEKIEVSRKYIQEDLLNNLVKKIGNENLTEKEIESLVKDTEKLVKDEIKNVFKLIEEKENIFNKNISFSDFILTLANSSILSTRTIVGNYLEVSSNAVQKNIINVIQNLFNKDKISFSYRIKLFDRVYQFNNILQFLESIKEVESLGDKYVNSIAKIAKNNLELDKSGVYKLGLKDKFINNILSLGILKNGKSLPVFGGYIDLISRGIQGGEKIAVSDAQSRFFLKTISNLGVEKYLKDNSFDIIALKFAFDFKNSYSDLVDYILKNKEDNKKAIELLGLNENNKEKVLKTLINGSIDYIKKETYRNENVITKFLVQQKNSKNYFYKTINLALNLGFKFAKVLSNVADKGLQVNSVLYALSRYYSLNYKISKERLKETNQPLYYLKKQELNSVRNYAIFGSIVRLAGAGLVMGGLAGYDEEQDKVYLNIGDKKSSPIKYEFAMWALQTGIFTQTYVNKDKVDGQTPLMTAISELRVLIPELNFSSIGDKSTLKQIETMAGSSIAADFLKQTKQAVKETYNKFNEVTGVLEKNKIDISGEQKENIFNNIATEVLFNVFLNPTINYAGGSSIKTFTTDYGADAKTQIEKLKKSFNVKNIFNLPRKEKTFKIESENELKNAEMYVFGDKSINFINKISNKLVVKDFLGKIAYFEKIKKTPNFIYNNLIYQGKYKTDNGNNIVFSKEQKNEVDRKFEENLSIMINAVEKNINFVGLNPNNDYEEYNIDDFLEDNKDIISKVRKIEKNSENITPKEFENLVSKIRNKAKTFTENWVKHKYRGKIKEEEKNK